MNKNAITPAPYRLTIGVTGHRRLHHIDILTTTIHQILDDVQQRYSGKKNTPVRLCVLSPLAEGADRLLAKEILNHDGHARLQVVLPLAREDYLKDFATDESKNEFNQLMGAAKDLLTLKDKALDEEFPENMMDQARCMAYEDAGHFVVDSCDILIAVWDKKPARGQGGTANIVQYAQNNRCPVYIIDANRPESYEFIEGNRASKGLMEKIEAGKVVNR